MVKKEIYFTFTDGRSKIIKMTESEFNNFEEDINIEKPFWKFDEVVININKVVFYEEL